MALGEEWVIWNGAMGVLDMASIDRIESVNGRRDAFLAPPYAIVGPFSLDALVAEGRIAFGECLIMSRQRWREDQTELRIAARAKRRAQILRMNGYNGLGHRETLDLPLESALDASQINAAFRKLAKAAHPDAGGSDALYRRIAEARDALLELFSNA